MRTPPAFPASQPASHSCLFSCGILAYKCIPAHCAAVWCQVWTLPVLPCRSASRAARISITMPACARRKEENEDSCLHTCLCLSSWAHHHPLSTFYTNKTTSLLWRIVASPHAEWAGQAPASCTATETTRVSLSASFCRPLSSLLPPLFTLVLLGSLVLPCLLTASMWQGAYCLFLKRIALHLCSALEWTDRAYLGRGSSTGFFSSRRISLPILLPHGKSSAVKGRRLCCSCLEPVLDGREKGRATTSIPGFITCSTACFCLRPACCTAVPRKTYILPACFGRLATLSAQRICTISHSGANGLSRSAILLLPVGGRVRGGGGWNLFLQPSIVPRTFMSLCAFRDERGRLPGHELCLLCNTRLLPSYSITTKRLLRVLLDVTSAIPVQRRRRFGRRHCLLFTISLFRVVHS